jgi:hypothetical protein
MINLKVQVRQSNMNENPRQQLFAATSFSSSGRIDIYFKIKWIFLLTKKWG